MCAKYRERARRLRKNMTDAEQFVWLRIRYRQLGGFKFRRQHPLGPFIADFVCLERKLVLELDGGQHAERADEDAERTRWLEERGYRVFRLWNFEAFEDWDAAAEQIWALLQGSDQPNPPPAPASPGRPPPQGGR